MCGWGLHDMIQTADACRVAKCSLCSWGGTCPAGVPLSKTLNPLFSPHMLYELPWPLAFIVNALWKVFRSLVLSFKHMHNTEVQRAKGATQRVNMKVFETDSQVCFCHPSRSTTRNVWLLSLEKTKSRRTQKEAATLEQVGLSRREHFHESSRF